MDLILTNGLEFLQRYCMPITVAFYAAGMVAINRLALLRGRTPNNVLAYFSVRSFFFSAIWLSMNCIHPLLGKATLLYGPFYLDLSEHYGAKIYTYLYPTSLKTYLKKVFRADVVPIDETQANSKQYMIGIHPHGILPIGSIVNLSSIGPASPSILDRFYSNPKRVILAATSCFLVPGWRELLLAMNVFDCSRANALRWLQKGYSICIVPGGAREGLYSNPDIDWLDLRRKRGFFSLALQFGVDLIPTYTYNEVDLVNQVQYHSVSGKPIIDDFRIMFQKTFGISFPLITGLNLFSKPLPRFVTVVGKPISCPKIENPSDEDIDRILQLYCSELASLYEKFSAKFNSSPKRLLIT